MRRILCLAILAVLPWTSVARAQEQNTELLAAYLRVFVETRDYVYAIVDEAEEAGRIVPFPTRVNYARFAIWSCLFGLETADQCRWRLERAMWKERPDAIPTLRMRHFNFVLAQVLSGSIDLRTADNMLAAIQAEMAP